ncbi:hypothetical protein APA_4017 [Pseudanabaena sp. lw0831]|nr:hypothetical protein APA_4017 [Pseudanabaena sp. lw0831]
MVIAKFLLIDLEGSPLTILNRRISNQSGDIFSQSGEVFGVHGQ